MSSEYEVGAAGTEKKRKDDPLKEYREKEAMTPKSRKTLTNIQNKYRPGGR
jgi:hypothetical protein